MSYYVSQAVLVTEIVMYPLSSVIDVQAQVNAWISNADFQGIQALQQNLPT